MRPRRLITSLLLSLGTALAVLGVSAAGPVRRVHAATITVTNTNDSGEGSLRQAIANAAIGDTVNFNLTYPAIITLTSGEINVTRDITIAGPGADLLAIRGNGTSRVFNLGGSAVTLADLTVAWGNASGLDGGGIYYGFCGGMLTLTNVSVLSNTASYGGGVYLSCGNVTLNDGEIGDNNASSEGGGVYVYSGSMTLSGGRIRGNTAPLGGGVFIQ